MSLPGFSAEASLYNGKLRYQSATESSCYGGIVQPALTLYDVIHQGPKVLSYCWELHCFQESHVGSYCVWINRCLS